MDSHPYAAYENAGNTRTTGAEPRFTEGVQVPDVSVEVISSGAPPSPTTPGAPGRLTVTAASRAGVTLLELTASGGAPVDWRLWTDAPWLRASRTAGTLAPGESVTLRITVDPDAQPVGAWTARVGVDPSGAMVSISGRGRPAPQPSQTPPTDPTPTPQPPTPTPTPTPTPPTPTPKPTPTPTPTASEGTVSPAPAPSASS